MLVGVPIRVVLAPTAGTSNDKSYSRYMTNRQVSLQARFCVRPCQSKNPNLCTGLYTLTYTPPLSHTGPRKSLIYHVLVIPRLLGSVIVAIVRVIPADTLRGLLVFYSAADNVRRRM